jgi:hypothetical protein
MNSEEKIRVTIISDLYSGRSVRFLLFIVRDMKQCYNAHIAAGVLVNHASSGREVDRRRRDVMSSVWSTRRATR